VNFARQENAPLIFGGIVAILLHLLIGLPVLSTSWGVGGGSYLDSRLDGSSAAERKQRERMEQALKELQDKTKPDAEQDDLVKAGLDKGSDAGMAWIGYEEYQEHIARHSETDQAAFTEKASGGGAPAAGAPSESPPSPTPTPTTAIAQEPTPPPTPAPEASPPPTPPNVPIVAEGVGGTLPVVKNDPPVPPVPPVPQAPATAVPESPVNPNTPVVPATPTPTPTPTEPAKPEIKPSTASSGAPQPAPAPGTPGPAEPTNESGQLSDRESDATSIIDAPPSKWRNGKPLAQKGLEVLTKKPELPILTRLTTSPTAPICEILFGKDGKPVTCRLLVSSGSEEVDGPVLDALYRWRARGSQLDKLAPGKTLRFRVRFILN
jgi:hypothetical protein